MLNKNLSIDINLQSLNSKVDNFFIKKYNHNNCSYRLQIDNQKTINQKIFNQHVNNIVAKLPSYAQSASLVAINFRPKMLKRIYRKIRRAYYHNYPYQWLLKKTYKDVVMSYLHTYNNRHHYRTIITSCLVYNTTNKSNGSLVIYLIICGFTSNFERRTWVIDEAMTIGRYLQICFDRHIHKTKIKFAANRCVSYSGDNYFVVKRIHNWKHKIHSWLKKIF